MKKLSNILWGIVLIAVGVIIALKSFDIIKLNVFFDGWWTLFIIVPCFINLFGDDDKIGNIAGIIIGVLLLLGCQDVIGFSLVWKLVVPIIVIAIGIKLVVFGAFCKREGVVNSIKTDSQNHKKGTAIFAGADINLNGEKFSGAKLTALFGGIDCDLRSAVIESDCVIKANVVFGGIDIIVPENVNIKVNSNSIFGGVSNNKKKTANGFEYTIYVEAQCVFGGVEIK